MHGKLARVLPHGVMLAASVALFWVATGIEAGSGGRIGPGVWPKAIIVFMGLLCVYEIVKRLFFESNFTATGLVTNMEPAASTVDEPPAPADESPRMFYGGVAAIAAYVLAAPWLGFFVTTALFLTVFPWIGGLRRPILATVLGVVGSLLLVGVFMRVAYISLPLGEGPFRAVSLALMRALGVS
jgi:putative tricarboxylic transport membrane protein